MSRSQPGLLAAIAVVLVVSIGVAVTRDVDDTPDGTAVDSPSETDSSDPTPSDTIAPTPSDTATGTDEPTTCLLYTSPSPRDS